jgi:hypothetical protein
MLKKPLIFAQFNAYLVVPGLGRSIGASHHGARETGECAGRVPSGRDAMRSCLFSQQNCRYESKPAFAFFFNFLVLHFKLVIYCNRSIRSAFLRVKLMYSVFLRNLT